jgi:hypothetical protein
MNVRINIDDFTQVMSEKFDLLRDNEVMLRPVCFDLIDLMTQRIHIDGKDSQDRQIGTYSDNYMKVRTGQGFKSKTITRGPNKGGVRQQYNRTNDTKVIASLTRQLEGDWTAVATNAGYGVGFNNEINFSKTQWLEATYKKKIFELTQSELDYAVESFNLITGQILDQ